MQFLIILSAVLALASANPGYLGAGYLGAGYLGAAAYHGGYASNILTPSGDTIEVAAAKANHFQAHANARSGLAGHGVGAYGAYGAYGAGPLVDPVAIAAGAPLPVGDTHEVAVAKAAHFQAHANANAGLVGHGIDAYGAHAYGAYGAYGSYGAYGAPALHAAYGTAQLVDPVAIAAGAPLPVSDTHEVAAAKAAHFQAHLAAKAGHLGRKRRSPGYLGAGLVGYGVPSYGYSAYGAHASPLVYATHGYAY